ncbi:osomolarity two-component system, phosphorelay intermediate protein YPD1 [Exophiala aquamarina CBS 119918]|uniref:Osomolarity two-component system, phosphorelay intermediate protein YPD1 n=1 Tax=Exophiala aquamarina CBS 119918 TaxID=1182545 RepID=A0A072PHN8_9EURO|nr:osomolarity two-component system, phosphorelay intermediate protein YPD1 [Exophiala aquamarina CBS 119918]KEF55060.1 osomolarity two-component system, phosphorelay intermediate protein YPD1 [Exophiala aquamarina CBS 119918]
MDEEDDREFSRSIVFGFLEQAEQTFIKMETALKEEDLPELASLGHFLKGSSATLGFTLVKDECEKIQHYGHQKNETGELDEPDKDICLQLSKESITKAKAAYLAIEALMKKYYAD